MSIKILDTLEDYPGMDEFKVFFKKFIDNFMKESLNFYKIWDEFPFSYREKQVISVIIPAIHECTNNVFLEQPFKKESGEQRFLDIVTADKNNNIYLIELKHAWNGKKDDIDNRVNYEWETAIEQISDLNHNNLSNLFYFDNTNIFRIALLVLPTYLKNATSDKIMDLTSEEYANSLFKQYQNDYDEEYQANLIATWKLENPEKFIHEYKDEKQIFPFVSFICRVEKI